MEGDGSADSSGAAGDDCHSVLEWQINGASTCLFTHVVVVIVIVIVICMEERREGDYLFMEI